MDNQVHLVLLDGKKRLACGAEIVKGTGVTGDPDQVMCEACKAARVASRPTDEE